MDFDIHQLDDKSPDSEGGEAAFEAFQQALLERFAQSPEGQERLKADADMGFWAGNLMYYGYQYEGSTVPQMTVATVRTVVIELFPRKISLQTPEEADDAIPELVAFWKYLGREFRLPRADAVLEFLREVEPDFPGMMNDPSNFGMAKSFFTMGQAAGYDMTTQEGLNAFMLAYNASLLSRRATPSLPMPMSSVFDPPSRLDPAKRKAEKKRRKRIEEARKRNRKRRK
jgi:hypothetical protein